MLLEIGGLPQGLDEQSLKEELYYYDPDSLPGLHEVSFVKDEQGRVTTNEISRMPNCFITINGETYDFPHAYVTEGVKEGILN